MFQNLLDVFKKLPELQILTPRLYHFDKCTERPMVWAIFWRKTVPLLRGIKFIYNFNMSQKIKAGYEYLLGYKLTVPIYDHTVIFCKRHISPFSRTNDPMTQSARSGMQNVAEGNKQQSLAGYIKLSGVARGSLEELLKDYLAFARQNKIPIWPAEKSKREIREIGIIWGIVRENPTLPDQPNSCLPAGRSPISLKIWKKQST
jgi:four helix bundle protein